MRYTLLHTDKWTIYSENYSKKQWGLSGAYWWKGWPKWDNYWHAYPIWLKLRDMGHADGVNLIAKIGKEQPHLCHDD